MSQGRPQRAAGRLLRPSFVNEVETDGAVEVTQQSARVFDFRRTSPVPEESHRREPDCEAVRKKKISRIVGVAIEKLDDDQLGSLLAAVERIVCAAPD